MQADQLDRPTDTGSELAGQVLEFLGAGCVLVAAFALDWRAGLAVLGVLLIVLSVAVSRR